jgi:hypothetical protein
MARLDHQYLPSSSSGSWFARRSWALLRLLTVAEEPLRDGVTNSVSGVDSVGDVQHVLDSFSNGVTLRVLTITLECSELMNVSKFDGGICTVW